METENEEIVIDSLPYFDKNQDRVLLENANALIEKELTKIFNDSKPIETIPEYDYTYAETKIMKDELKRIEASAREDGLDLSRYGLYKPTSSLLNDINAWNKSLDDAMAQVTHQSIRKMNLEISEKHAAEEWKNHCNVLDSIKKIHQEKLLDVRKEIQNINWKRKSVQEEAGKEITIFDNQWAQQTMSNFELQMEIAELKSKLGIDNITQ